MEIPDIIEMLRNPGEEGLPADLADSLQGAYDAHVTSSTDAVASLTDQLTEAGTTLEIALAAQKAAEAARTTAQAANIKLLAKIPGKTVEQSSNEGEAPTETTISDLIEY